MVRTGQKATALFFFLFKIYENIEHEQNTKNPMALIAHNTLFDFNMGTDNFPLVDTVNAAVVTCKCTHTFHVGFPGQPHRSPARLQWRKIVADALLLRSRIQSSST